MPCHLQGIWLWNPRALKRVEKEPNALKGKRLQKTKQKHPPALTPEAPSHQICGQSVLPPFVDYPGNELKLTTFWTISICRKKEILQCFFFLQPSSLTSARNSNRLVFPALSMWKGTQSVNISCNSTNLPVRREGGFEMTALYLGILGAV